MGGEGGGGGGVGLVVGVEQLSRAETRAEVLVEELPSLGFRRTEGFRRGASTHRGCGGGGGIGWDRMGWVGGRGGGLRRWIFKALVEIFRISGFEAPRSGGGVSDRIEVAVRGVQRALKFLLTALGSWVSVRRGGQSRSGGVSVRVGFGVGVGFWARFGVRISVRDGGGGCRKGCVRNAHLCHKQPLAH